MYSYTINQWIILFFEYALVGYIWEVSWISLRQKKLCNRGFLYGPVIPIYGFGAIVILHTTLPAADNYVMIFILGMLSATALEFVTGALMLWIFKVRYWDYSNDFANIKGYICLRASLAWGVFSLLLVKLVHPIIDKIFLYISAETINILSQVLLLAFAVDTAISVKNALDLKAILEKILADENNNGIPDILEEIPDYIKQLRANASARLKKLFIQNPSAVFHKKLEYTVRRLRKNAKSS